MAVKFCCDLCDKPLPIKMTGVDGTNKKITAELSFPREVDVHEFFPHLCESCTRKIDIIAGLSQDSRARKADILKRHAQINEERRRKLGTKG